MQVMRKRILHYSAIAAVQLAAVCAIAGCSKNAASDRGCGMLRLSFPEDGYRAALENAELPDTNDFILEIRDSGGEIVYSGYYGDSPESLSVPPGSYTVSAKSFEFSRPQFSRPQYGDEQCVIVPSEGVVNVSLECRQINSGIRLRISPEFLTAFPDGVLFVSSEDGKLMYSYSEKRIAYFRPGSVSVVLSSGGKDKILMTRKLSGQEILTVGIQVSDEILGQDESSISIAVDTSRIWTDESYVIGEGDSGKGSSPENSMTVAQARTSVGARDVWVCGYIVGGDLTKTSVSFSPPFNSDTNLAIAPRSSAGSKESCISVSLPAGEIREELNLVDHPGNIGRRVYLNGDIVESYYGLVGIKNVSDCVLK